MMPAGRSVRVDPRLCEAHALCIDIAPEVFELGDDIAVSDESPDATRHDDVDAAIAACPRQAISWVEAPLINNFGRPIQ
jgi:ferredoxin